MAHRYVPILRWKRGERVGVQSISSTGKKDVVPMFLLGTDQYVGTKETKKLAAVPAPAHFAAEVSDIWGTSPFFLDAGAIVVDPGSTHPLVDIAAACRAKALRLIPATKLAAPAEYQAAVIATAKVDGRGIALRVTMSEFTSVPTWLPSWPVKPQDTDLIVDFEDNVATIESLGATVHPAFTGLHLGNKWRSVTICGTSMPENFSGLAAGSYSIVRTELKLWKRLSGLALPYSLDFGDYATVAVTPPPSGIKWGFPINARYTLKDEFFICKGVPTTGPGAMDMRDQLIGHAQTIKALTKRGRLPCWADDEIDKIASGGSPGALEHWVTIAVCRHVEVTRHHLP